MTFNEARVVREKQVCGYFYPAAIVREAIEILSRVIPEKKIKQSVGRPKTGRAPRKPDKPRPSRVGESARRREKLAALALV